MGKKFKTKNWKAVENDRRTENQLKENDGDCDGHQQTGAMEQKQEIAGNNEASTSQESRAGRTGGTLSGLDG